MVEDPIISAASFPTKLIAFNAKLSILLEFHLLFVCYHAHLFFTRKFSGMKTSSNHLDLSGMRNKGNVILIRKGFRVGILRAEDHHRRGTVPKSVVCDLCRPAGNDNGVKG